MIQIKVLNCVGMMYCGDRRLKSFAEGYLHEFVSFCHEEWTRPSVRSNPIPENDSENVGHDWRVWIQAESSRRTGYCIWVCNFLPLFVDLYV
jgi:hypothetical protein